MDNGRERRRYPRFKAKEGTLAINNTILGPIINISMGGMIFEYYNNDIDQVNPVTMGFYYTDSEFLLTGLKSRILRNQAANEHLGILPIIRKQCAIEFLELTQPQRMMLKRFLHLNTNGPA